jgi:hypothetical protein
MLNAFLKLFPAMSIIAGFCFQLTPVNRRRPRPRPAPKQRLKILHGCKSRSARLCTKTIRLAMRTEVGTDHGRVLLRATNRTITMRSQAPLNAATMLPQKPAPPALPFLVTWQSHPGLLFLTLCVPSESRKPNTIAHVAGGTIYRRWSVPDRPRGLTAPTGTAWFVRTIPYPNFACDRGRLW